MHDFLLERFYRICFKFVPVRSVASVLSSSCDPWTVARQASLCMGFSRQEYWGGLMCPPLGDLPNPGIEPESPALQVDSLPWSHTGGPLL